MSSLALKSLSNGLFAGVLCASWACGQAPNQNQNLNAEFPQFEQPKLSVKDPRTPLKIKRPQMIVESKISLREVFDNEQIWMVGVTVEPDTGRVIVLDANSGLYVLGEDQELELLADLSMMIPSDGSVLWSAFTDVTALGNNRFALVAMNDGFLLDLEEGTFTQYFCYVPGDIIDEFPSAAQFTQSLTYDVATQTMYAQPQTFEDGVLANPVLSQLGRFDIEGGEGYGWMEMPRLDFLAGGIAVKNSDELLLGEGAKLHRFSISQERIFEEIDLSSMGISQIDAMAMVPDSDELLIIDAETQSLISVSLNMH